MPGADQPAAVVSAAEAAEFFKPFLVHRHLVLAVSGGSDSIALMHLAAHWAGDQSDRPRLSVVTVDHGLRAEAGDEALMVRQWALGLGLEHHVLHWQAGKPSSGLQAAARTARYQLMSDWCLVNGAQAIACAHTADDQAETVLMRLARGSGLDGLSGMLTDSPAPWPILRPLLGVTRARLRATLTKAGQGWIDDPSNEDERFERIRMRKALAQLEPLGLSVQSIALSARRLARARQALDLAARDLAGSALTSHGEGFGELDLKMLLVAPDELQLRVLQQLVWQFGSHEMPKMAALERVAEWIGKGKGRARTIAGCRIVRRSRTLVLGREPGRVDQTPLALTSRNGDIEALWDRRFRLVVRGARKNDDLTVVPFGAVKGRQGKELGQKSAGLPAFVRDSLPAVLDHGVLHSVPHLGVLGDNANTKLAIDAEFLSNR